jgi:hypothetical protein
VRSHLHVGDRVQVRTDGGSPAARKYAGKKGRVTMRGASTGSWSMSK